MAFATAFSLFAFFATGGPAPLELAPRLGAILCPEDTPAAHVRGPVPGLSIRAYGRQATLAPVQEGSARALVARSGVSVAHRPQARIARGATPAHVR